MIFMAKDVYIFEATEDNFDETVLQNSHKLPVITLFMGVWSEHCFVLTEIFSNLAKEFAGQFIFAKVDIDEQKELLDRYKIVNVPTINIIKNAEVVLTSEGLLTEDEARVMLKGVQVFHLADAMRDKARKKHMDGDTEGAIVLLSEAIQKDPSNTRVALDMVQIFIDIKQFEQANGLLSKLPKTAIDSDMGKSVSGQLSFINLAANKPSVESLLNVLKENANDLQAKFDLAICLTANYQYEEAITHLIDVFKVEEEFLEGASKELLMTLIGMLKTTRPEIASNAQQQLSNLVAK